MKKYQVRICVPYLYEVEAENEEQAEIEAWKLFQDEKNDWIAPDVEVKEVA